MRIELRAGALASMLLVCVSAAAQDAGVLIVADGDCARSDRMVIATRRGFTLAEQYRGRFREGDRVYGELNRYGFKDVKIGDPQNGRSGRVYIDDYAVDESTAKRWCSEQ